jgi:hypothetical protein
MTVCGAAISDSLLWCVRNPASAVGRFLNVHLGVLSCSIYMADAVHKLCQRKPLWTVPEILYTFPYSWLATLVVAELSYYLVERPSLRLRNYLIKGFGLYAENRRIRQAFVSSSNV